jgi:hypothetical protein
MDALEKPLRLSRSVKYIIVYRLLFMIAVLYANSDLDTQDIMRTMCQFVGPLVEAKFPGLIATLTRGISDTKPIGLASISET